MGLKRVCIPDRSVLRPFTNPDCLHERTTNASYRTFVTFFNARIAQKPKRSTFLDR